MLVGRDHVLAGLEAPGDKVKSRLQTADQLHDGVHLPIVEDRLDIPHDRRFDPLMLPLTEDVLHLNVIARGQHFINAAAQIPETQEANDHSATSSMRTRKNNL